MKKRHYRGVELALLLAALLVTILLACGCGAAVPGRQNADPASAADPAPADPTTEATPPATGEDNGNILALWTQSQNRLSAYTEDGFYFLSHEKYLPGAMNIKYIDFATRQETFLCAVPNCTHDTDACTIRKWDVRTGKDTVLVDNMPVGSRQHVGHLVWRTDVRHHALVLQP